MMLTHRDSATKERSAQETGDASSWRVEIFSNDAPSMDDSLERIFSPLHNKSGGNRKRVDWQKVASNEAGPKTRLLEGLM
ncbi:hypothetical protein TNCV_2859351 [Trichonephila clavipes]|nr:hypothetical protein TNCV_2859351 [Trichonephila clavipes]